MAKIGKWVKKQFNERDEGYVNLQEQITKDFTSRPLPLLQRKSFHFFMNYIITILALLVAILSLL